MIACLRVGFEFGVGFLVVVFGLGSYAFCFRDFAC